MAFYEEENHKSWSWTTNQHRRHTPGRYRHMMQKRKGWLDEFNTAQRLYNRQQLHKLVTGMVEEAEFLDKTRHEALWQLH